MQPLLENWEQVRKEKEYDSMHAPTLPNHTLTMYNTVSAARGPPTTGVTLWHMELDDVNIDFTSLEVSLLPSTSEHRHDPQAQ